MWTSPRETIRAVVDRDPTRWVILLAWLSGVAGMLLSVSVRKDTKPNDLPAAFYILLALYMGPLGGFYQTYIAGFVARWSGRIFGGQATDEDCRAAVAWGSVPTIGGLLLWPPAFAVLGSGLIMGHEPPVPTGVIVFWIVQLVLLLWSLALQFGALSEVHGISLWRTLGAAIVGWLAFVMALVGLILLAMRAWP